MYILPEDQTVKTDEMGSSLFEKAGDPNVSIINLSCRTSDLQFSLVLQTHALVLYLKAYAIKNMRE